jgi:hypothetical protein
MAPFAGAVDGVNEKGLCIAYNYAYTTDVPPKPSAPISRFEEILEADRPLNLENLQRIMADHGGQDLPTDTTICVHGTYWTTTASLQLFPRSRRIRVAYDYACRAQHEELAL